MGLARTSTDAPHGASQKTSPCGGIGTGPEAGAGDTAEALLGRPPAGYPAASTTPIPSSSDGVGIEMGGGMAEGGEGSSPGILLTRERLGSSSTAASLAAPSPVTPRQGAAASSDGQWSDREALAAKDPKAPFFRSDSRSSAISDAGSTDEDLRAGGSSGSWKAAGATGSEGGALAGKTPACVWFEAVCLLISGLRWMALVAAWALEARVLCTPLGANM